MIFGNKISSCGRAGISLEGIGNATIMHNDISDTPIGVDLKNCEGEINIKKNKGTRLKTFVRINEESKNPVKVAEMKKNIEYQALFNKKIKELLNLEAQAKFLKNYGELKKIRFLKAHLKIKI